MDNWTNWIPLLVNSLIAAGTFFILWRKASPEINQIRSEAEKNEALANTSEAQAAKTYAEAADLVGEQLKEVRQEVKDLRKEIDVLNNVIREREKLIMEQTVTIEDLKDWAERLIFQLRSRDPSAEPVPFRPRGKLP